MNDGFFSTSRKLLAGQSTARILMNRAFSREELRGRVIDVGGGRRPDYFEYFKKADDVSIEAIDASLTGIDFEKDPLPYQNCSVDTVICANVLEHVYHHRFLISEMHRVLKSGGRLIGFVPFLVGYHPDPRDYFRYTREALERLLAEASFADIQVRAVGGGPLLVNFNTIVLSVPRLLRPVLYVPYALFDKIFLTLRPKSAERTPLGFVFTGRKA